MIESANDSKTMQRSKIFFVIAFVISTFFPTATRSVAAEKEAAQKVEGKITIVTLYRGQARVTREVPIPASDLSQQIVVTGLPPTVGHSSIFAESDNGVAVRSLRVSSQSEPTKSSIQNEEKIQKLSREIDELKRARKIATNKLNIVKKNLATLEKLVDFSASKSIQDLNNASLNVDSVTKLADFSFERQQELATDLFEMETEIEHFESEVQKNEEQRSGLYVDRPRSTLNAAITVDAKSGGTVRLIYDVPNVTWTPTYSIRAVTTGKDHSFELQLDALVQQHSGESWDQVQLTLATQRPDVRSARPVLTPLRVQAERQNHPDVFASSEDQNVEDRSSLPSSWIDQQLLQENLRKNLDASRRQVNELTSAAEVQRQIADDAADAVDGESYSIDSKVSLASQNQNQTITVFKAALQGDLHKVVTPLLSSYAFREAELTNSSNRNLISAEAMVYLNGKYVGKTTIPPTTEGQRLIVGFGSDRKIRTRRELLNRSDTIQGANRRSVLDFRLVVSNYHDQPVDIRLIDRIPVAAKDGSIDVTLSDETSESLSDDGLFKRLQFPTGVLRWDLLVPAKRFGSKAYDHDYQYTVELDRQHKIISHDLTRMLSDLQFEKSNNGGMGGGGMGGGSPF